MRTCRSILVPLDGGAFAEQALARAVDLARRSGAILQVALVHQPLPGFALGVEMPAPNLEFEEDVRRREQAYLDLIVNRLVGEEKVRATSVLLEGLVAQEIESHVQATAADLVIISTHGRSGMGRFWLGSVTDQLMQRLEVPVIAVRPGPTGQAPPVRAQRILVALDGSPFAETILEEALNFGRIYRAEYDLVSVVEPPVPLMDLAPGVAMDTVEIELRLVQRAERYLARVVANLCREGQIARAHVVKGARVHQTLLDQADRLGVDLIAIATHGLGGLKRLALGSVTDKVVRESTQPVLILRPKLAADAATGSASAA